MPLGGQNAPRVGAASTNWWTGLYIWDDRTFFSVWTVHFGTFSLLGILIVRFSFSYGFFNPRLLRRNASPTHYLRARACRPRRRRPGQWHTRRSCALNSPRVRGGARDLFPHPSPISSQGTFAPVEQTTAFAHWKLGTRSPARGQTAARSLAPQRCPLACAAGRGVRHQAVRACHSSLHYGTKEHDAADARPFKIPLHSFIEARNGLSSRRRNVDAARATRNSVSRTAGMVSKPSTALKYH